MISIELVALGLLLPLCSATADGPVLKFGQDQVPGIAYIAAGYNILKGNPFTTNPNGDAGLKKNIFDLTDCSDGNTYNGYNVPNDVDIKGQQVCSLEQIYNEMTGTQSYASSIKQSAETDVKFGSIAFSASEEFQSIHEETESTHSIYISSYAKCGIYRADLAGTYTLPAFHDNFIEWIAELPSEWKQDAEPKLFDFLEEFGTHYINAVVMGGRFGTISNMEQSTYSRTTSSKFDLKLAAKYSTISLSAASATLAVDEMKNASWFQDKTQKTSQTFMVGGDLPVDGDVNSWSKSLQLSPMPIKYYFKLISALLTAENFPNDEKIAEKQEAVNKALDAYCETLGNIECGGYGPDPLFPPQPILKGLYSVNAITNPYTDDNNCPINPETGRSEYVPVHFKTGWDYFHDANDVYQPFYYCLNEPLFDKMKETDPYHEFGGFYQKCRTPQKEYTVCMTGNKFMDDACECPPGYKSLLLMPDEIMVNDVFPKECQQSQGYSYAKTYLCYNPNQNIDLRMMGGAYATCGVVNPYTQTKSCPVGFQAYKIQDFYYSSSSKKCSAFICFPIISPE